MADVLVDSNVHLDVLKGDLVWREWSVNQIVGLRQQGTLFINHIIYAELAAGTESQSELDRYLNVMSFVRLNLSWNAAFLAGRAFKAYQQKGGNKSAPLPNFYIGAHALVEGLTLLTRDASRYKTYFPKLKLIAP